MANLAPAFVTLNPSYMMPELLLPYSQASGAFDLLAKGEPLARLSEGDQVAYIKRVDVRTKMAAGQSSYNQLPSAEVVLGQISTASYLLRVRAEYDHHDQAAFGRWGVSLPDAQRLATRQAHFQLLRNMVLYGMNPSNGEGIVNSAGATSIDLPPDSNGHDTVITYDNGEMALFLMQQILAIKTRTVQLGMGRKFTILGPQRTLGSFEYNVVQLVQFQRAGAGTDSTKGMLAEVLKQNKDEIEWCYDDTLIGKGDAGADLVIITMPEVEKPSVNKIDTNEFAKLAPGLEACTLMLCDMQAPREIPTPIAGGAIDILSELRATSGWAVRPEAVQLISMIYE